MQTTMRSEIRKMGQSKITSLAIAGKDLMKRIVRRFPRVEGYLKARKLRRVFRVELALLRGTHVNPNTHASIIHFSLNKAATQYVKDILRRCAAEIGMVSVALSEYAFDTDFPFLGRFSADEMLQYRHVFKPAGYLYSPFGGMIDGIEHLDRYKVILLLRDPRDILVSQYYSMAHSHPIPDRRGDKHDGFMEHRKAALSMTIDEYVLAESDILYRILNRYKQHLIDRHPNVYLTTYEKMIADFPRWLNDLLAYCDIAISDDLRRSLLEENIRLRPKQENMHKHVRRGTHGDYLDKLRPETIKRLNEKFSPLLEAFGYAADKVMPAAG